MIQIENLRYRALSVDSLSLKPGITSVIGPNGSGKTTFLKLCAGIAVPDQGTILIDGAAPRQTDIGWVGEFPDRNFLFETVADEIVSPLRFRHDPEAAIERSRDRVYAQLGLAHLASRPARQLSGGEKVLVALAAAMVAEPRCLILDECDSHLDAGSTKNLEHILRTSGIPFIIRSTQDMETARAGDHLLFVKDGRVRHAGTPDRVFRDLGDSPFQPFVRWCLP
jgi:energy-coupling factor transport system ATP-binding protein